ncbi:MAG: vWA domain-containing protein [Saprospiraceae bacterium]
MKQLFNAFLVLLITTVTFYSCTNASFKESAQDSYFVEEMVVEMAAPNAKSEPTTDKVISGESYAEIVENDFLSAKENALSTFSIDVDRASYSNMRRFLNQNQLPPKDAIRIEEMVNYFKYDYPQPTDEHPLSITTEFAECPWNAENRLVSIGLQGRLVDTENIPPMNLVFLIDVSGSMGDDIVMMKEAFKMLVNKMRPEDKIAIVTYAGASGLALSPTSGNNKRKILAALSRLQSGGSTAGSEGINLAYKLAKKNFVKGGNNRVILATDGDFNVGVTGDEALVSLIEKRREEGVFLSVLGFGMGNYQDAKMEQLADNGNGNYAYIDNIDEAKKVFVTEMSGTLYTIAKDVKLQLEFDSKYVESYRLIGYENRLLANEDFDNDAIDAGDMGAGHTVTALYEIVPAQNTTNKDLIDIKFRYKQPEGNVSQLLQVKATDKGGDWSNASLNTRWAASVASFGMVLRDSKYKGNATFDSVKDWAKAAKGADLDGYRGEMIGLIESASVLSATN